MTKKDSIATKADKEIKKVQNLEGLNEADLEKIMNGELEIDFDSPEVQKTLESFAEMIEGGQIDPNEGDDLDIENDAFYDDEGVEDTLTEEQKAFMMDLEETIEKDAHNIKALKDELPSIYETYDTLNDDDQRAAHIRILSALEHIDRGNIKMAEKIDGKWVVNDWAKTAISFAFRLHDKTLFEGPVDHNSFMPTTCYDKIPSKFTGWDSTRFDESGIRVVPGSVVRKYVSIAKGAVIMPSVVNIGASIGENTMIDMNATIGSCAQIGKNCHISSNSCIAGVLEPAQARPVIIEDNCFIGACCSIAEGMIVGEGSVVATGTQIGSGTKIIDRETGDVFYGEIPPYSVVVPGSVPAKEGQHASVACAVIVKRVDEKVRAKTAINELLRF